MARIELRNIQKFFGAVQVLKDVNLTIEDGEFVVMLGQSGCGKTTTLRAIAGLETVSSGTISIDGREVQDLRAADRDIAFVFQSFSLYPHMTVYENIAFPLRAVGMSQDQREAAVREVAKVLGIERLLNRKPSALSGGDMQRVAIGRALVRRPKALLMDEPIGALDAKLREQMRAEIKRLHIARNSTSVYVTHDQIEAMTLSTRIAVMNKGFVQQLGTPKEIYDTPANLFVATFMGSPAMNIVPATVEMQDGAPHARITDAEDAPRLLRFSQANLAGWAGKDILLGIRPEAITDPEGADRKSSNIQSFANRVTVTEPAGSDTFVTMTISGKDAIARMRADATVAPGEVFDFAINMEKAVAFDPATEERIPA
jgi:multiple sugar transport system ATP-binding protein